MKVLFITDRNLTHDVRIFQQMYYAKNLMFISDLVAIYDPWTKDIEPKHVKLVNPIHSYYIKPKSILSVLVKKISSFLWRLFPRNIYFAGMSLDTRSYQIWKHIKKIAKEYDLILGFGLFTLLPIYLASKKYNKTFGFDIASFVAEKNVNLTDEQFHKIKFLLKNTLPSALYLTYSSELIAQRLLKFLSNKPLPYNFPIANSYDESFFSFRPSLSDRVEFVWLAQKIDFSVNLELVLPSLEKFRDRIRLNIFGQATERFKEIIFSRYKDFVVLHEALPVDKLIKKVAQFDIGLAVYITYVSPQKNYTLTNKVYLFAQSGLYTLATDTISHRIFYSEHPDLGKIVLPDIESLSLAIADVIQNIESLRQQKHTRYIYSKRFAWKYESQKLYSAWKK